MKKKVIAALLAGAMLVTGIAGCSAGGSSESGSETTADGKTKLTALFVSHSATKDVEEMKWLQEIEEECNVEVEWEQVRADWETVKSTRFASGDIPDLLFNATTNSDYTKYTGLFQDLTDLIEENAPNIQEMFTNVPDTKTLATSGDGKIYSIPKMQTVWPKTNTVLFINKTWLDNLGLEMPTTFSEFEEVMKAFKEKDPNGNGQADEIPLDYNAYGGNNAWFNSAYSLLKLFPSMGIQLTDTITDGYFVEDKTVKCFAIDDRYKQFIKTMNRWYEEGLINPNAITNDYSAYQSLSRGNENGEAVVGACFAWEETDKFGNELATQYEPVPPLVYDDGVEAGTYETYWNYDFDQLNMQTDRVAMNANCENKEAAMKFIDAFYDKTTSVEVLFGGISDGCVEKVDDNNYKVLPPQDETMDPGTWKWTSTFADFGPMYIREDVNIEMSQDMTNALEERTVYEDALNTITEDNYYPQLFMKYSEADQNTLAMNQANINNIIDNYWSLWITGESDIDADWESYVESVEGAGLQQNLEIRQAAFDSYLESK